MMRNTGSDGEQANVLEPAGSDGLFDGSDGEQANVLDPAGSDGLFDGSDGEQANVLGSDGLFGWSDGEDLQNVFAGCEVHEKMNGGEDLVEGKGQHVGRKVQNYDEQEDSQVIENDDFLIFHRLYERALDDDIFSFF
jgi:hypothetical protein